MAKIGWGRVLAGVATAAAAGAAYIYFKQRAARAPLYETLLSDGLFEIRRYPPLLAIETVQTGSRDRALGNGFGLLAGYMFGEGREGDEIPIVMPVLATPGDDGGWHIRFLLPQGTDRAALEQPGEGVAIIELPGRELAVVSVPGKPTDRLFANRAAELRRWLKGQGRAASGNVEHAYYNSPLKPGKAQPNELFIPLAVDVDGR
jgi:hypothetical protein